MTRTERYIKCIVAGLAILSLSCGGGEETNGDDSGPEPQIPIVTTPSSATLIFPDNNSECTEGEVVSESQSRVLFQWNASENTDSYQVNLRNLNTNSTALTNSAANEVEITLLRGVPYEWFVVSRANGTNETAKSEVWKFYNAGPGITNYAPFPAQAVSPTRGATIDFSPSVELVWSGSDVDNDIISFNLYYGTTDTPQLLETGLTATSFEVDLNPGQTYYWQAETLDSAGNTTQSELFNFRVD